MSKSLLSELTKALEGMSDPNAIFNEPIEIKEEVKEDVPLQLDESNIEQMLVGDGFEALLSAFNSAGHTGKRVFLNLLQDHGIIAIMDDDYTYKPRT